MTDRWLIVGGGPSFECCYQHWAGADVTVAVSSTIAKLSSRPDIFLSRDIAAFRLFAGSIEVARELGTVLVTDEFLKIHKAPNPPPKWWGDLKELVCRVDKLFVRGEYTHVTYSGALAVMLAVNSGAKEVVICGLEGYGIAPGEQGRKFGSIEPDNQQSDMIRQIVDACPDVQFTFRGMFHPVFLFNGSEFNTWPPDNWTEPDVAHRDYYHPDNRRQPAQHG